MSEVELVQIINKEPMAGTYLIAEGFGVEHDSIKLLLKKYSEDFTDLKSAKLPSKGGRKATEYLLTEEETSFLGMLLKNTTQAVAFKRKLNKEFYRMRKILIAIASQKQNTEWLEARKQGKAIRREQTDSIKVFIEYAKENGSKNAGRYYCNITKMENKALFLLTQRYPNLRNVLNVKQLSMLSAADQIVERALQEGVDNETPYKEIYQIAKDRVLELVRLIGESPVPELLSANDNQYLEKAA